MHVSDGAAGRIDGIATAADSAGGGAVGGRGTDPGPAMCGHPRYVRSTPYEYCYSRTYTSQMRCDARCDTHHGRGISNISIPRPPGLHAIDPCSCAHVVSHRRLRSPARCWQSVAGFISATGPAHARHRCTAAIGSKSREAHAEQHLTRTTSGSRPPPRRSSPRRRSARRLCRIGRPSVRRQQQPLRVEASSDVACRQRRLAASRHRPAHTTLRSSRDAAGTHPGTHPGTGFTKEETQQRGRLIPPSQGTSMLNPRPRLHLNRGRCLAVRSGRCQARHCKAKQAPAAQRRASTQLSAPLSAPSLIPRTQTRRS